MPTHKPVTTDTLARWIHQVMPDAGIDITSFGAHSVYLTNKSRSELIWWQDNINPYRGRSISDILGLDDWQFEMYSDASMGSFSGSSRRLHL